MAPPAAKEAGALLTIGEVSALLGVPQHVLRFWETRFPSLRPLQRGGGRRYYRPGDVALARRIAAALGREGYTIRGVQQLLAADAPPPPPPAPDAADPGATLLAIRDRLAAALAADDAG